MADTETCQKVETFVVVGLAEITVMCGKEVNHDGPWHEARTSATVQVKDGEDGRLSFHWREK